jgi:hypothetical protein
VKFPESQTLSANQDGDAIGGSVDVRIKQATSDQPYVSIEGMGGFTPIKDTRKVFSINSAAGMRFGQNTPQGKRFGIMLGYSYDYNGRGIDDVEPSPDLNSDGSTLYDSIDENEYLYDRTRYGFAAALDYKLSENSDLYAHGLFSNFRDYGEKYEYEYKNGVDNSGSSSFHTSVRRPNLQIASLALGGKHVFNHSFLHYQIAAAHSRFGGAAGNPGADFGSNAQSPDCGYSPSTTVSIYRPQFTCINPSDAATDPIWTPGTDACSLECRGPAGHRASGSMQQTECASNRALRERRVIKAKQFSAKCLLLACVVTQVYFAGAQATSKPDRRPQAGEQLKFVLVLTRHGVRSPTWTNARLDEYAKQAWPQWPRKASCQSKRRLRKAVGTTLSN